MDDYRGYVNLTEAARLVGVSVATLSRQKSVGVPLGGRDIGISPREVLRQADFYKRRPLTDVAGELVERAYRIGPDVAEAVTAEVDEVLSARPTLRRADEPDFLSEARRVLPHRLFAQVARYYQESGTPPAALGPVQDAPANTTDRAARVRTVQRGKAAAIARAKPLGVQALRTFGALDANAPASAEPTGLARKAGTLLGGGRPGTRGNPRLHGS